MSRILWLGDAADTGFGRVTTEVGKRLIERGHDVRFLNRNTRGHPATGALAGREYNWDYFSPDAIVHAVARGLNGWKPEQAVLLADHQFARDLVSANVDPWKDIPVWHHVPIEGHGIPPLWGKLWDVLKPVAITRFGAEEISRVTGRPTPFIYHGVDTSIFHPVSRETPILGIDESRNVPLRIKSKTDAKRHFNLSPDDTILLRTDRHMPRKNYNSMLRAVAPVLEERPDIKLVIHCKPMDYGGSLYDAKSKLPRRLQEQVGFTEGHDTFRGMGIKTLAALYNAADVYLSNCSEGYGLALIEAVACGVPVLGLDYSSVPEVVGPAGVLVKPRYIDNIYSHYWAEQESDEAYAEGLRQVLTRASELGALGPAHAATHSWDRTADQFSALFAGGDMTGQAWVSPMGSEPEYAPAVAIA